MKRMLLAAAIAAAIAALALSPTALAKGPSAASITGPGLAKPLELSGNGETGSTGIGLLTQQTGFFAAAFGGQPSPMLRTRPPGDLGPRYLIDWTVPDSDTHASHISQELYPYAHVPVTYMAPGQKIFGATTPGGWFQASLELKRNLVADGLPATPPAGPSESTFGSTGLLGLLIAALVVAAAASVIVRRRLYRV